MTQKKNNPSFTASYKLTNRAKLKRQLQEQRQQPNASTFDLNQVFSFIMTMTFNIFRYNVPMIDHNLTLAIKEMIRKRITLDKAANFKGFQFRHAATFFPSGTKWREKPGFWREFSARGIRWLWLRASRGNGCHPQTSAQLQQAEAA